MQVNDALDAVLLGAFFFGLIVTGLAFALGIADLSVGHFGDIGHVGPHGHLPGHVRGVGRASGRSVNSDLIQPINIGTMMAFVTWFGGVAYLVRNGLGWWAVVALPIGFLGGFSRATLSFSSCGRCKLANACCKPKTTESRA